MNDDLNSRAVGSDPQSRESTSAASEPGAQARAQLEEISAPLRESARQMAEQQRDAGADHLADLGRAVHGAATGLEKELPHAAHYIHTAADGLESASSKLRERSIDDLVGMFDRFAKHQPAAAFAGAVLAGFALSRFLKSSKVDRPERA